MQSQSLNADLQAARLIVKGRVQGLGVRPAVARLANRHSLAGSVFNTRDGLEIELEGSADAVNRFIDEFADSMPSGVFIDRMEVKADRVCDRSGFHIGDRRDAGGGAALVPQDRVVCQDCLGEVRNAQDRRHEYAFTSCSTCGPRFTIIDAMPYDRAATSLRGFAMCAACTKEYRQIDDRRFHAQTNACPECGPQLQFVDAAGRRTVGQNALGSAALVLRDGRILALKGLGGYQLLVDADNPVAVRRLRERKRRPHKPLAILVGSVAAAEELAQLNEVELKVLLDPAGPIVVVSRRAEASLAAEVAPGYRTVGLMLPTTPLHSLLCDKVDRPLVCTSGNAEGRPLAYENHCAEEELRDIADAWLHHDRAITRPVDDSVIRVIAGSPTLLRMARGYAPQTIPWPDDLFVGPLLALGGEQKAAFALWNGSQAVLGPHIGDLTEAGVCERWSEQLVSFMSLYGLTSDETEIAHDRHPEYFSSQWAQRFTRRHAVQHHHAHIAAVLLEHGDLRRKVLGLAWDGTGYGDDGTIWGGEALLATGSTFRRVARLRPFPLVGGDAAVREPWRVALALVDEALGREAAEGLSWPGITPTMRRAVLDLTTKPALSPVSSSMGRLFDAVAGLALGIATSGDEGRPAILLEEICNRNAEGAYAFGRRGRDLDWRPVIVDIVRDLRRGADPGDVAMRFHRAVADLAAALAATYPDLPLATSGGVFQNALLGELLLERLERRRPGWLRPQLLPPGDGGLAMGQLAVAASRKSFQRSEA